MSVKQIKSPISIIIDNIISDRLWSKEIELKKGDFLKLENTKDTNLYLVEEGSLRFFINSEEAEVTIRFGYTGDLVTALDSYISENISALNVQALRKTKLKVILKSAFVNLIQKNTDLKLAWESILSRLLLECMEREIDILTKSPLERYKRVLARSPRLFQEVPHKYIASYLNMTPETLSRIKKS